MIGFVSQFLRSQKRINLHTKNKHNVLMTHVAKLAKSYL